MSHYCLAGTMKTDDEVHITDMDILLIYRGAKKEEGAKARGAQSA